LDGYRQNFSWFWLLKILVLIFGYQIFILLISFPFGQFRFSGITKKILRRFGFPFRIRFLPNRLLFLLPELPFLHRVRVRMPRRSSIVSEITYILR
jgi:hypothetical protein